MVDERGPEGGPSEEGVPEPPPPRAKTKGRRLLKWGLGLIVLVSGSLYGLTMTQPGYDLLLTEGLDRLDEGIPGSVVVGAVRSGGILEGVLLSDVTLLDPAGRTVLEVDSIRARYSLIGLLRGNRSLARIELWGPRMTVRKYPGENSSNLLLTFRGTPDAQGERGSESAAPVAIHRTVIHDGEIRYLRGEEDDDGVLPAGARELRRTLVFRDIQAELSDLVILDPAGGGEEAHFDALSLDGLVFREGFRIEDFQGTVRHSATRIEIDAERFWLPGSETSGTSWVDWGGAAGFRFDANLTADVLRLEDLRWLMPEFPDVSGGGEIHVERSGEGWSVDVAEGDFSWGESRVRGDGGILFGDEFRLVGIDAELRPLRVSQLDRWLPEPLPFDALLSGHVSMGGPLRSLTLSTDLEIIDAAGGFLPSRAVASGVLRLEEPFGATGFELDLNPLDFRLIERFKPAFVLGGTGSIAIDATGLLGAGIRFTASVEHHPHVAPHDSVTEVGDGLAVLDAAVAGLYDAAAGLDAPPATLISAEGSLAQVDGHPEVDADAVLLPLSLASLAPLFPNLDLRGTASGPVRVTGPLTALQIEGDLQTTGGLLTVVAEIDAGRPGESFQITGATRELLLSALSRAVPEPTLVSGSVRVGSTGTGAGQPERTAVLDLGESSFGYLRVERAQAELRFDSRIMTVDTIIARTSVLDVEGFGALALPESGAVGELYLTFQGDSLGGLRPFLLGDTVIARDTLSPLLRRALPLFGVNPDTLPSARSVAMEGAVSGVATLVGSLDRFTATGSMVMDAVVYGFSGVERADVGFSVEGLPALGDVTSLQVSVDELELLGRHFQTGEGGLEYDGRRGELNLVLRRDDVEEYRTRLALQVDSTGGLLSLDELLFRFPDERWNLGGPASVRWSDAGLTVRDLRLIRPGVDGMRIEAEGVLPRQGDADFRIGVRSLDLKRLAHMAQSTHRIEGEVDGTLTVTGAASAPLINTEGTIHGLRLDSAFYSRAEALANYENGTVTGFVQAWDGEHPVMEIDGSMDANLSLVPTEEGRFTNRALDVIVRADSLPLSGLQSLLGGVELREGWLSGESRLGGTSTDVQPRGEFRIIGGVAAVPALGIAPGAIGGTVLLRPNREVEVALTGQSRGTARVEGTITLEPLTNPVLDLSITAGDFLSATRRDLNVTLGGRVTVEGNYRAPIVRGDVRIEEGELFLEEFARTAEIVDLAAFDPGELQFNVVDTTLVRVRPIIEASRNPFLQNLRVDVNLVVDRDAWIRSPELNVDMAGELQATYDRGTRELVLSGTLDAVRGNYVTFGRQFVVQGGTVEFLGTPGVNPSLRLVAANRLRRADGEALNIIADVQGTLLAPRVALSSDSQPPIAEDDLVSYLIFGRPSYALASGETAILQGALGASATLLLGTLASQLGSVVAKEIGFDYFAISATGEADLYGLIGLQNSALATQVEIGEYIGNDIFLALLLRPLSSFGSASQNRFSGARVEWRFADQWTWESFYEDRFSRDRFGFGELGFRLSKVVGVSFFREWGY